MIRSAAFNPFKMKFTDSETLPVHSQDVVRCHEKQRLEYSPPA